MKPETKAKKLGDEAKELDRRYLKLQLQIKEEVLKDYPSKLHLLLNEKEVLRKQYVSNRKEITQKISSLRLERRGITKEAYLRNPELQSLKRLKDDKWEESQKAWMEWHKEQEEKFKKKQLNTQNQNKTEEGK